MAQPNSEIRLKITLDNVGAVSSVINLGKNVDNTEGKVNGLSDSMNSAFSKNVFGAKSGLIAGSRKSCRLKPFPGKI